MEKVYGIDLGTTYSCIAYIDESGKPAVLKNIEDDLTTPSVVYFETDTDIHVGKSAKNNAIANHDKVVSSIKAHMGEPDFALTINGKKMRPEEISAYILKKITADAETSLEEEQKLDPGEKVKKVVITCPAYFGVAEREATKKAGEIAGLDVLDIINEPTAAAIAYGMTDDQKEKTVMVYDLGGGTFDVTMIHVKPGDIHVICSDGDKNLGGNDWDEAIVDYLAEVVQEQTGSAEDIRDDEEALQQLYISVEEAKKLLSTKAKAPIAINFNDRLHVELTREKFDELTKPLLDRTIDLTRSLFKEAKEKDKDFRQSDISEILLVGGSSYMPQVKERVESEFHIATKRYEPNQAVAKGAAIYAANRNAYNIVVEVVASQSGKSREQVERDAESENINLEDEARRYGISSETLASLPAKLTRITNVSSRSFGVVALYKGKDEKLFNIIYRNSDLPTDGKDCFNLQENGQRSATIRVMENLSSEKMIDVSKGREVGCAELELPADSKRSDTIEVVYHLDESGILTASAKDLDRGSHVEARFEVKDAMTQKEVDDAARNLLNSRVD